MKMNFFATGARYGIQTTCGVAHTQMALRFAIGVLTMTKKTARIIVWASVVMSVLIINGCGVAMAFTDEEAVRSIMGEARGEFGMNKEKKFKAMLLVGHAIKNRATLKGVYGLRAKGLDKEPAWVWDLARKAWKQAKNAKNDPLNGMKNWHNVRREGENYWTRTMPVRIEYGNHVFMKEK